MTKYSQTCILWLLNETWKYGLYEQFPLYKLRKWNEMLRKKEENHWLHPFILVLMTETPKTESDCYLILYSVIVYFMFKEKITFQWSSMNQIFATYSLQLLNGIWKSFKIHAIYEYQMTKGLVQSINMCHSTT
jgi:hypothetical protein